MERDNTIFMKDFEAADSRELRNYMVTIGDKNEELYKRLLHSLRQENFPGMREDVLICLADHADSIMNNNQFVFHFLSLLGDVRVTPDYYVWLIEYSRHTSIDISDIMMSVSVAVDKGMPLCEIQECFKQDDFLTAFEEIEKYNNSTVQGAALPAADIGESQQLADGKDSRDSGLVSVFGDLMTIMTMGKRNEEDEMTSVQQKFDQLVSSMRQNIDAVSSFLGKMIHEWDMDKEEILRLKAIYNIQQRVLSSQHQKMYEADQEISRLRTAIYEAEEREAQYKTISKKVLEIQTLTASSASNFEDRIKGG